MSAQQGGEDKNTLAVLWIFAGIGLFCAMIWYLFSEQLKLLFINIRTIELYIIYWIIRWLPLEEDIALIKGALNVIQDSSVMVLDLDMAEQISEVVGKYLCWPSSAILGYFTYSAYSKNVKMRYKKRYDMEKLAKQESSEWPQINPILNLNLVKKDLDEGSWAMAMSPILFCKYNKLLEISLDTSGDMFIKGPKFKATLLEDKAEKVFINQLGRLWHSPESMPIYRQALFAAFLARGCRDSNIAKNLIIQINRSCVNGELSNLDFSGVVELWKKYYQKREIQEIIQAHAYESTLFMSLFLFARKDGVFPCSDFLWLKPIDRRFWYILNSVGRQTPVCEAAGVYAHFLAEKNLRRKLNTPVVQNAVKALKSALSELIYVPDNDEKDRILTAAAEVEM